ncbi:MAG: porin [Alphaproteobacteria bacterium]|nr:MAG: porin [Alphaproteobacteria bacterium]
MKKVLLAGTAIAGVALLASPAKADLKLDLGGYFRGYMVYADNDEVGGTSSYENLRSFEFKKDAEVHFTGETTTDMGLTVGVHAEMKLLGNGLGGYGGSLGIGGGGFNNVLYPYYQDGTTGTSSMIDESYIYFSGGWGRVNFGNEDGAAYLLQVAAPSADSNIDGLRPTIQGFNSDVWNDGSADQDWYDPLNYENYGSGGYVWVNSVLGYDNAQFRSTDRITYLTPKWNGFQAGVSYAPNAGQLAIGNGTWGMSYDDVNEGFYEHLWEASARWDGEFQGFGISVGGGYSDASPMNDTGSGTGDFGDDDYTTWDAGLNLSWQGWSLGGAYLHSNTGTSGPDADYRVWDVGLGWDNGPWHLGASWWNGRWEQNAYGSSFTSPVGDDLEVDRYAVGGGYTYGPGMSFRGAVAWLEVDNGTSTDPEPSQLQVTLGTDVNF